MFVDYNDPGVPADVRTDLCIVGAGAAGIALAMSLERSGLDVCVLESGGLELDAGVQALYEGESVGLRNASPMGCRIRYFGGTTSQWQGWCAALRDVDFQARPWVPHSGWPITKRDLDPYYPRAAELCELKPLDATRLPEPPRFDAAKLGTDVWRYSPPTRFGEVYREPVQQAQDVTVLINCNALKLHTDGSAAEVRHVDVATLSGKRGRVTAGAYVLACGGMENTRLLLLSNDTEPGGLGNRSGTLGRFFLQHIEAAAATLHTTRAAALAETFELHRDAGVRAHFFTSPDVQRSLGTLHTGFSIGAPDRNSPAYRSLRDVWRALRSGRWPDDFGKKVRSVAFDLDDIAADVFVHRNEDPTYLDLGVYAEQSPNASSTIGLGAETDPFGLPRIRVNWQLSAFDRRSIAQSTLKVAEELGRLGLGRLQLANWVSDETAPWPQPLWSGCHHMGTTRMSADPTAGVVNADCRVHGVDNLYVASTSVFPTGGFVPPTLTLLALTLRLGDHLVQRFG